MKHVNDELTIKVFCSECENEKKGRRPHDLVHRWPSW
jgi:hypothetical protein